MASFKIVECELGCMFKMVQPTLAKLANVALTRVLNMFLIHVKLALAKVVSSQCLIKTENCFSSMKFRFLFNIESKIFNQN